MTSSHGGADDNDAQAGHLVVTHALTAEGADASEDGTGRGTPLVVARSLSTRSQRFDGDTDTLVPVGFNPSQDPCSAADLAMPVSEEPTAVATWDERNVTSAGNRSTVEYGSPANTLHADPLSLVGSAGVRRLTPLECERLQSFPDGYTDGQPDSVRYRQLGNAVCTNVAEWIGRRIVESGL